MEKITLKELFDIIEEADEQEDVMQPQKAPTERPEELRYENKERIKKKEGEPKITKKEDKKEKKEEPKGDDVSASGKFKSEMVVDYDIKDDFGNNSVGETGQTHIVIDGENYNKMATYLWDNIIKDLDVDFFKDKKKDTTLKFYLDANCTITSTNEVKTVKIYFDVGEKEFKSTGWSFNVDVGSDNKLDGLDEKLGKWFESLFPSFK